MEANDAHLLSQVEQVALEVLTLIDGLTERELAGARLTRRVVHTKLSSATDALSALGNDTRSRMPEVNWTAWLRMGAELSAGGEASFDAMWCMASELAGPTLLWLRLYRHQQPDLFTIPTPARCAQLA